MPDQTEEVAATMMTAVSASVKTPAATGIVTETAAGAIAADGGIAATLWTIKGVYGLGFRVNNARSYMDEATAPTPYHQGDKNWADWFHD